MACRLALFGSCGCITMNVSLVRTMRTSRNEGEYDSQSIYIFPRHYILPMMLACLADSCMYTIALVEIPEARTRPTVRYR
jgi:hypothetical protein